MIDDTTTAQCFTQQMINRPPIRSFQRSVVKPAVSPWPAILFRLQAKGFFLQRKCHRQFPNPSLMFYFDQVVA